ncbi:MAG: FtsX-like permease family protein [Bacteroidetes bacterium]|nr:FtsX-like permease family protein [Bacteroidota bacterium]
MVTTDAAEQYFGNQNPIGQQLRISQNGRTIDLTVSAVIAKPDPASHLSPRILAPFDAHAALWGYQPGTTFSSYWYPSNYLYAVLSPDADVEATEGAIRTAVDNGRDEASAATYDAQLQPITDIHLYSDLNRDAPGGSPDRVYLFIVIAAFILGIACVNFVNLATAQGTERTREIGVRMSIGAGRGQLVRQLLTESMIVSLLAGVVAVVLTIGLFPAFQTLIGTEMQPDVYTNPWLWVGVALVVVFTGIGAGSYPAAILTRLDPSDVLSRRAQGLGRGAGLRKSLVVLQFAISAALIVATTIAFQQLQYVEGADLGFDDDALISVAARGNYATIKREMESRADIQRVVGTMDTPGTGVGRAFQTVFNGEPLPDDAPSYATTYVDFGFFEMLDLKMAAGRPFSADHPGDIGRALPPTDVHFQPYTRDRAVVINESMARSRGWTPEEALGQTVRSVVREGEQIYTDMQGEIVGVVEDFHFSALREPIRPLVMYPALTPSPTENEPSANLTTLLVKASSGGSLGQAMSTVREVWHDVLPGEVFEASFVDDRLDAMYEEERRMSTVREVWHDVLPGEVFEASFVDDRLDAMYEEERRTGWLVGTFAGLAIFVACLGLFGLAAFAARQRTKEIGIRKALGASVVSIVRMISSEYVLLVSIAVLIASPVAYLGMSEWLEAFAYRIELGVWPFAVAILSMLLVAVVTVGSQALRAARVDPATTLRDE